MPIDPRLSAITRFSGEYSFLSNFYRVDITLDGEVYPTLEHAFQAAKTDDKEARRVIRLASTPGTAKYLGRRVKLRDGWDDHKIATMHGLLVVKFGHPDLLLKLESTRGRSLIEGNTWGDKFWGAIWSTKQQRWVGHNWLGRLLMSIRDGEDPIGNEPAV